ncbi:methyltransferase [Halopenitus salinus]|uniref:Methyltransferase n=1 Tax=Halopenitus salinus TaxID=1198295 RepID=A0ABD5V134_9EURY
MQPYIDEDDSNLLDIGCANGWLTSKFHNEGLFCIGVDRAEQMLTMARSGNEFSDGLGYVRYNLTPESVSRIPSFDVILLLTVYHHWVQAYGNSAASDMLRHLGENSEKLFFELPEQELHDEVPCPESQPIKEYHLDYLNEVFGSDKAIEFIGRADYKGEERRDLLYIISSPRSSE